MRKCLIFYQIQALINLELRARKNQKDDARKKPENVLLTVNIKTEPRDRNSVTTSPCREQIEPASQ